VALVDRALRSACAQSETSVFELPRRLASSICLKEAIGFLKRIGKLGVTKTAEDL
jgi:hypothetical protein